MSNEDKEDTPVSSSLEGGDGYGKEAVTLMLEQSVLRRYQDANGDWQERINAVLRAALKEDDDAEE